MSIDTICERSRTKEYIPTHQYVKFEDDMHYLCRECWDLFKGWYYRGARTSDRIIKEGHAPRDKAGVYPCNRCETEEHIPPHQNLGFGDEPNKVRDLCQACYELFKGWYYHGARSVGGSGDRPT